MSENTTYNTSQRAVCPRCNGEKTVEVYRGFFGHTKGHVSTIRPCPFCLGSGIVLKHTVYSPLITQQNENIHN